MSLVDGFIARLRDLFARSAWERRIDQELRFHIDMETERWVREGVHPADARRRALARFGGVEYQRERLRDGRAIGVAHIGRDIRFAVRSLLRRPGFLISAALSLGLGLTVVGTVAAVLNAYASSSLPYSAADRLYYVMYAPPGPVQPRGMEALNWASVSDVIEAPIATASDTYYLSDANLGLGLRGLRVSRGFLRGLGVRVVIGRGLTDEDFRNIGDRPVLLGYSLWRERFGNDSAIIGRVLRVERETGSSGPELLRVVGVLAPGFWFGRDSREVIDLMEPLRTPVGTYMIRLRAGAPVQLAEQRLTNAARAAATWLPPNWSGVKLEGVHERYVAGMRPILRAVTAAAMLLLVITFLNVAALTTLRALRRQREIAVRVSLGAGVSTLLRMFVTEMSAVTAGAMLIGALASAIIVSTLGPLVAEQLGKPAPGGPATLGLNTSSLAILMTIGIALTILLALVPALTPWQKRLFTTLTGAGRAVSDNAFIRRLRSALVFVEIAASLALLICCGLLIRSARNMQSTDLARRADHLVRARIVLRGASYPTPADFERFYRTLGARITDRISSEAVFVNWPPFAEPPLRRVAADGGPPTAESGVIGVDADYFTVAGIRVIRGRGFTNSDRLGTEPVAVVSESVARLLWPNVDPIGRRINVLEPPQPHAPETPWRVVVGVASDVSQTYDDATTRDVYLPYFQTNVGRFATFITRTAASPRSLTPIFRSLATELDPLAVVHDAVSVASEDRELARARFLSMMLTGFAAVASLLALLGIYSVTAYAVQQRERELAIRLALGATPGAVFGLLMRHGTAVVASGTITGAVFGVVVARFFRHQLYGVTTLDAQTLAIVSLLMLAGGIAATAIAARRAATASPIETLSRSA